MRKAEYAADTQRIRDGTHGIVHHSLPLPSAEIASPKSGAIFIAVSQAQTLDIWSPRLTALPKRQVQRDCRLCPCQGHAARSHRFAAIDNRDSGVKTGLSALGGDAGAGRDIKRRVIAHAIKRAGYCG